MRFVRKTESGTYSTFCPHSTRKFYRWIQFVRRSSSGVSRFSRRLPEFSVLVGCDDPSLGNSFPNFRDDILVTSLRVLMPKFRNIQEKHFVFQTFQFLTMISVFFRNVWNQLSIDRASYPRSRLRIPQLVSYGNKVRN